MLEHYLIPLAPLVFTALTLIACLMLFTSLEKEIRTLKSGGVRRQAMDLDFTKEFKLKLDQLSARVRDAEDRAGIVSSPVFLKPSLNLNRRTQVIRMSRRGEPSASIAAALSIPRKEVELLLKVYGLTLNDSNEKASSCYSARRGRPGPLAPGGHLRC
jgi:hypothetical protein